MADDRVITNVLSAYIGMRDKFRTEGKRTLQTVSDFNQMINASHMELFGALPNLNLAELEAFAELANSRLSWVRSQRIKKG